MNLIWNILTKIRMLSLDVAVGGVVCTLAVAKVVNVELPITIPICLFLAIWCIYTIDHLMDALKLATPSMQRHQFHKKYFKVISIAVGIAILAGGISAWYLPYETFIWGVITSISVGLYFLVLYHAKFFVPKELMVGIGYAIGIFLGPISLRTTIHFEWVILFVQFALLAVFNLILFSDLDKRQDLEDGVRSWATRFSDRAIKMHYKMLFIAGISSILYSWFFLTKNVYQFVFQDVIFFMFLTLQRIVEKHEYDFRKEKFRLMGDAIFLYPGLVILFAEIFK